MTKRKTTFPILLAVLLFVLSIFLTSCGKNGTEDGTESGGETAQKPFSMAVISDIHLLASSEIVDADSAQFTKYAASRQRMLYLSEAIFRTAVDDIIASGVDVLLVSGDMTENGSKASAEVLVSEFSRLENAGVTVCVTGGISDFRGSGQKFLDSEDGSVEKTPSLSVEEVPEVFARFGYGEAISRDSGTQSYTVDLPNSNYRLLVIDTSSLYESTPYVHDKEKSDSIPPVTDELMEYLELSLMQAEEDEKEVIAMSYFPVNSKISDYVGLMTTAWSIISIDRHEEVSELLRSYGVKYCFSGRLHSQNVLTVEDEEYGTMTEYGTACLTNYPTPVRYFTAQADGTLLSSEKRLSAIKEEYLPDGVTEEVKQKVMTDLQSYEKEYMYDNTAAKLKWSIDYFGTKENELFLRLFRSACLYEYEGVDNTMAEQFAADLTARAEALAVMPLYGEGDTVESECKKYGIELPKTDYKNALDLISTILCGVYSDDMNLVGGCDEAVLLRYVLYRIAKEIADFDLFGRLAEINDTIAECDLHPIVDKVYRTDILDITLNEFIVCFMSIVNVRLREESSFLRLNFKTSQEFLDTLATLLPVFLSVILDEYNAEEDTLWGVPYTEYINVSEGLVNMERLIDDFLIDIVIKDLVF